MIGIIVDWCTFYIILTVFVFSICRYDAVRDFGA